jgi:hypothetical protein
VIEPATTAPIPISRVHLHIFFTLSAVQMHFRCQYANYNDGKLQKAATCLICQIHPAGSSGIRRPEVRKLLLRVLHCSQLFDPAHLIHNFLNVHLVLQVGPVRWEIHKLALPSGWRIRTLHSISKAKGCTVPPVLPIRPQWCGVGKTRIMTDDRKSSGDSLTA